MININLVFHYPARVYPKMPDEDTVEASADDGYDFPAVPSSAVETTVVAAPEEPNVVEKMGMAAYVMHEVNADPYDVLKTNKTVNAIHENCKRHEARTEELFK